MTITQSFYAFVSADAGITALSDNIFPSSVPIQEMYPALTFSLQSDEVTPLLSGFGCTNTALMDVDTWDHSLLTAEALATAVKAALKVIPTGSPLTSDSFSGTMGSHQVSYVTKTRELHLQELDTGLYRTSMQFQITYGV